MSEQAVIVHFDYAADTLDPLLAVEDELIAMIEATRISKYDGHAIAANLSDGSLYLYGPNAEDLFTIVRPILAGADCLRNRTVILRYGPNEFGTPERAIALL